MTTPHVLAVPYPAQGHVIPMLELSQWLASHGIKVTFVNSHSNHRRVIESSPEVGEMVHMVSISDGLDAWEERMDRGKATEAMLRVMPGEMDALITKLNQDEGTKIMCVIADWTIAWAVDDVVARIGLPTALFSPAAAAALALGITIPKLIADGIIDDNGKLLTKKQTIQLAPSTPPMNCADFFWVCFSDEIAGKNFFHMICKGNNLFQSTDWILCNSSHDLEAPIFSTFPRFRPIGPLLANNRLAKSGGSFWAEDSVCVSWLDQQPPNSVIYVAFGSITILDTTQFQELALGLELTNMPFLWVVRPDMTASADGAFPAGFEERVGDRGRMVGWAPQQEVLRHPAVACFVSHCGWNSTLEGVSNGVPFLCWPYFAEQFLNRNYICDEWKVGLGLEKDENGIITREEVKKKVDLVVGDGGYKERSLNLRASVMDSVRGQSHTNLRDFINWVKNGNNNISRDSSNGYFIRSGGTLEFEI